MKPTTETYAPLQTAYDFFNARLFNGELPDCIFTMTRNPRTAGYFSAQRWGRMDGAEDHTDEIAINPLLFKSLGIQEAMQTLVHEMVHSWQHHHGTPSRAGYHNKEWADKMEAVGLTPSSTGKPGGKRVGQSMSDYATKGGVFLAALDDLIAEGFALTWHDRMLELLAEQTGQTGQGGTDSESEEQAEPKPKRKGRIKYSCGDCGLNAWAKPDIRLICGDCEIVLKEQEF